MALEVCILPTFDKIQPLGSGCQAFFEVVCRETTFELLLSGLQGAAEEAGGVSTGRAGSEGWTHGAALVSSKMCLSLSSCGLGRC